MLADQSTGLLEPGAVALADLNGDGIPDLIVANSGSNNVLIYPGLGNGQFGPAINDGNGYFVGTNPVGITVAYLTGALPDLVVADEGSNQVSILLNTSQPGGAISFAAGPRLNSGGSGPVSTVVGNFTGGPYPDLLVTNSESNDVTLLPGVGQGFFNDQDPRIYSVGTDPVTSFVGNFNGQPDLVTVNAGSNDLTVISGFEGSNAGREHDRLRRRGPDDGLRFQRRRRLRGPGGGQHRRRCAGLVRRRAGRAGPGLGGGGAGRARSDGAGVLGADGRLGGILRGDGGAGGCGSGGLEPLDRARNGDGDGARETPRSPSSVPADGDGDSRRVAHIAVLGPTLGDGDVGASPGSPSSVQLVALHDTSLPLVGDGADADARGRE